jgi:hypothetical protein
MGKESWIAEVVGRSAVAATTTTTTHIWDLPLICGHFEWAKVGRERHVSVSVGYRYLVTLGQNRIRRWVGGYGCSETVFCVVGYCLVNVIILGPLLPVVWTFSLLAGLPSS